MAPNAHRRTGPGRIGLLLSVACCWQPPAAAQSRPAIPCDSEQRWERQVQQLGHADHAMREAATRALIAEGPTAVAFVHAAVDRCRDAEVAARLRLVLEYLAPPERGVLVVRSAARSGLAPGDLITHVDDRRVTDREKLRRAFLDAMRPVRVHVLTAGGPADVSLVNELDLEALADVRPPHGETIVRAVRLYAAGYAEAAYDLLNVLAHPIDERQLHPALLACIAYTAGDGARARELLAGAERLARSADRFDPWTAPSALDLHVPRRAPLGLEWELLTAGGPEAYGIEEDPDLRIERVLLRGHRYDEALLAAAHVVRERTGRQPPRERDRLIVANAAATLATALQRLGWEAESAQLMALQHASTPRAGRDATRTPTAPGQTPPQDNGRREQPLPQDSRVALSAAPGGPQRLIESATGRSWDSHWFAEKIGLEHEGTLFAQAERRGEGADARVWLMSEAGLMCFDAATQMIRRVDLPGPERRPALVPESAPYLRRDPRFVYCARLPSEGGAVYRVHTADGRVELLDVVNATLPAEYLAMQPSALVRERIERALREGGWDSVAGLVARVRDVLSGP
jgi:hypothetical protein